MMPEMDGIEACEIIRMIQKLEILYCIPFCQRGRLQSDAGFNAVPMIILQNLLNQRF